MGENWAPCRNCQHLPGEHEAIVVKPICVDAPARVLFEGTLGACRVPGCGCKMWANSQLPEPRTCRHCGGEITPCNGGALPVCKGWIHTAYAGSKPVGAHYCDGRSINPSAEPETTKEDGDAG